ncbi:Ger(x)C family spore germination protein [Clostridium sp. DJ247]|uniref:Ger(x)C family spore germination protein n=1 Tax=Clostridium sp. DJ247 TaxID=2726188 RepID=UPI001F4CE762|nr:Ger(x)C family spore germination protein [Clostridium sp. DJ247]
MRLKKLLSLILMCIILSGCWDKIEIDRKSLISAAAIDVGEQIDKEKEMKDLRPDEPFTGMDLKKLHVTFGAPDISKLGPEKGVSAEDIYINSDGYSMVDVINNAGLRSSRDLKFSHIKLLILSKDLMTHTEVVKEVADYLQREPSLNKMMYIVLSEGHAEDLIKFKPSMEKNIESYISGLVENSQRNVSILPVTLTEFLVLLNQNGNAMLPKLEIEKDKKEVKVSGVSLIKNYKLVGDLNPIETANLQMLRGTARGVRKVIYKENHPIDVSIDNLKRKITMSSENGKIAFNVNLELEGQVKDYYINKDIFSENMLSYLEENLSIATSKECEEVIEITQKQLNVDPVGFREYVEKYYPNTWNRIKDKWDEIYKNAVIHVKVRSNIRRIGVSK